MPGADEVFNEAEVTLDEQDEQLLASVSIEEKTEPKVKPKRKPLPPKLLRKEVVIDIDDTDKTCDCCHGILSVAKCRCPDAYRETYCLREQLS